MKKSSIGILTAAVLMAGSSFAFAQDGGGTSGGAGGEPPRLGDANPPGALRQGGVPPAAVIRRGDDMAPLVQRNVSGRFGRPQGLGNNPTPTRNDPPGTRTQCRGGCQ
jgi:hypothetical protein